jgi:DNA-directed RNA polymerase subunit M/transcription elongation factor TFIIS
MRDYAIQQLDVLFPSKGSFLESILYDHAKNIMKNSYTVGMDFYPFRCCYKEIIYSLLINLKRGEDMMSPLTPSGSSDNSGDNSGNILKNAISLHLNNEEEVEVGKIITASPQHWAPILWDIEKERKEQETDVLREGTFDCHNCARRGNYSRNTSDYAQQTRSADEPMTVFVHCHSCGKDYKFSS